MNKASKKGWKGVEKNDKKERGANKLRRRNNNTLNAGHLLLRKRKREGRGERERK